jgi:pimeloyl-ACP methyl ester carboxylesterase
MLQGARTLMVERYPWEARPPLDELAATPFPKLVVSGAHSAAFDAVCDVLAERLSAERAVLPGAGHSVQRLGEPFNELLTAFVERAEQN